MPTPKPNKPSDKTPSSRPPAIFPASPGPTGQSILRRALITLGVVLAVALGLYVATRGGGNLPPGVLAPSVAPILGATAPALTGKAAALDALVRGEIAAFVTNATAPKVAASFVDSAGKPVSLSDFSGKVVLLNVWATWCAPCRKEMPQLDALQKSHGGDKFAVVTLNMDRGAPDKAKAFLADINTQNLAFYHDPSGRLGSALGVVGMPTTLLLDGESRELGRLVGPAAWDLPEAIALVEAALK